MRATLVALTLCLLAAPAAAQMAPQRFAGTPEMVQSGQSLEVHYTHPGLPNQKVTVKVSEIGTPVGQEQELEIQLNEDGEGTAMFAVPQGWDYVVCQHDTSADWVSVVL